MDIPTEPIGSIPRPRTLVSAIEQSGNFEHPCLEPVYEAAVRDTAFAKIRARDALERKTEELALSLSMMKPTLDSPTDGILVTDANFRITGYNEKFLQMWQLPAGTLQSLDDRRRRSPGPSRRRTGAVLCGLAHRLVPTRPVY